MYELNMPERRCNPGDEVNGLSLYGVGSGTTIDYVKMVRGLDDAFEFFGGTVNCKHLIAYNCADDDFDMDDGFRGMIQFAISVKDPYLPITKVPRVICPIILKWTM